MFTLPPDRLAPATQSMAWGSGMYRSPHASYSATDTPQGWRNVLLWCQELFCNNGPYRMSQDRIVSYFLTDVEVGSASQNDVLGDDEEEKWQKYLGPQLNVVGNSRLRGLNRKCYGNSFTSLHVPFRRFLRCAKCKAVYPFKAVVENNKFGFAMRDYSFHATCPNSECRHSGKFLVWDEPDNRPEKLRLRHHNPLEIEILHDIGSDDVKYLWRIPEDYKSQIRQGKLFHLERVSQQVLNAIRYNQLFLFNDGVIYHDREPGVAGLKNRGWGFSPLLYNSRQIWYVELLHRYNEAIALDYVMPLRVLTPGTGSGPAGGDSLLKRGNLGDWKMQMDQMIQHHRASPTSWHTLPFPVQFSQFGGDANRLAPRELLDQGYDTLLNASGTPVEMYKGTLQMQVAPVAMRLFEATHHHLVYDNNNFLAWLVERTCEILSWEAVTARHRRVEHADDMQKMMMLLQMAVSGRVSETDAMRVLGLDRRDQRRKLMEEAREDQELQAQMQEEMDQSAFGAQIAKGMPPGGQQQPGMPPGGGGMGGMPMDPTTGQMLQGPVTQFLSGGNTPMTPEAMQETASSIANELLGLPSSQRISELRQLQQRNKAMHGVVKSEMEAIRSAARSQGGTQMMQSQYGVG